MIATAGSMRSNPREGCGCYRVFNRHDPNMTAAIMDWTNGEGVDRIIGWNLVATSKTMLNYSG